MKLQLLIVLSIKIPVVITTKITNALFLIKNYVISIFFKDIKAYLNENIRIYSNTNYIIRIANYIKIYFDIVYHIGMYPNIMYYIRTYYSIQ